MPPLVRVLRIPHSLSRVQVEGFASVPLPPAYPGAGPLLVAVPAIPFDPNAPSATVGMDGRPSDFGAAAAAGGAPSAPTQQQSSSQMRAMQVSPVAQTPGVAEESDLVKVGDVLVGESVV